MRLSIFIEEIFKMIKGVRFLHFTQIGNMIIPVHCEAMYNVASRKMILKSVQRD